MASSAFTSISSDLSALESLHDPVSHPPPVPKKSRKAKATPTSTTSTDEWLSTLLSTLEAAKARIAEGNGAGVAEELRGDVGRIKEGVMERQNEWYKVLKKIDRGFESLPPLTPLAPASLFTSPEAEKALARTIALYLARKGWWDVFESFIKEFEVSIPDASLTRLRELHSIIAAIHADNLEPALAWSSSHIPFLLSHSSPLHFYLHRSRFLRLLPTPGSPSPERALSYFRTHLSSFLSHPLHAADALALITALAFEPGASPYAHLTSTTEMHAPLLAPLFESEWCRLNGEPRTDHLRVAVDMGGGGALALIQRVRDMMKEKRNEWSQADELPVEIPVPPEYRFHSIFTCPVSKEQATDANPPMMLACGHVVARESLGRLSKGGGRVKCPYCPVESQSNLAVRIFF